MSCTEDEVIENVLTEIEVDEAYYYSREVVWAFASTPSGDLLSSEQLKNASTTILKSSSDVTEFDLTVLVFDDGATSDRFLVATYSYIPVKSIVRFAQAEPAPWASLQSQGKVSIDVRGPPENLSYLRHCQQAMVASGIHLTCYRIQMIFLCPAIVIPPNQFLNG
jgi:hypothetical protein